MNLMNRILFVVLALLVAGCGTLGSKLPDQRDWFTASCSGFKGWESCKAEALRECPKGFDIGYQEENQVTQKRTMQYACKP